MRTLRIAVILFLSMVNTSSGADKQLELKIGYVNPQSILANMPEMGSPTKTAKFHRS